MRKGLVTSLILSLWFFVPTIAVYFGLRFERAFMSGVTYCFERYGANWVLLKSCWYGLVGILIGWSVLLFVERQRLAIVPVIFALALVCADHWPGSEDCWNRSPVDRLISSVGYLISRIQPYSPADQPTPTGCAGAIPPRTKIEATTPLGKIAIASGAGTLRTITWDGVTRSLAIAPMKNFDRNDSLVFPSEDERCPGYDWEIHNGIARCRYYEMRRNFRSLREALAYARSLQNPVIPSVGTSDGLFVGWSTKTDLDALTITVSQILINGQPPDKFPLADDSKIVRTSLGGN